MNNEKQNELLRKNDFEGDIICIIPPIQKLTKGNIKTSWLKQKMMYKNK
jgi:hypothetical protein